MLMQQHKLKKMRPPLLDVLLPDLQADSETLAEGHRRSGQTLSVESQTDNKQNAGLWTEDQFASSVKRDLYYLFNTTRMVMDEAIDVPDRVQQSVLFYGFPNFCGRLSSDIELMEFCQDLKRCIQWFEPRLFPDSIRVSLSENQSNSYGFSFHVEAAIDMKPGAHFLKIQSTFDADDGRISYCQVD